MKPLNIVLLLVFLLSACAPVTTEETIFTPTQTITLTKAPTLTTPTPINTSTPTITPTPLPITFRYEENVPAHGRRLQEQAANKAYAYFSQYVELGQITVYTFYDIDLIMDEAYPSIFADGNITKTQLREGWPTAGGTAAEDKVLINPNHINWSDSGCYKPKNVGHEIFHIAQARLLRNRLRPDVINYGPEWLKEGSAEVMGHLIADGIDGCSYQDRVDYWIENISDKDVSLQSVEGGNFDSKSWFWSTAPLAVYQLVKSAPNGEESLFQYYSEIGNGNNWRDAFTSAFGLSIEDFYVQFEAYHESIKIGLDINICLPQSDSRIKCLGRKPQDDGYIYLFAIPFGFNTPPDQWTQESTCELMNQGFEGSTEAVTFKIFVEKSVHGTCHASFTSGEGKQFSIDFLVP
jgi:hypothetical protein